jgi:hypothetical protein
MILLNLICVDSNYILFFAELTELTLRPNYKSLDSLVTRLKRDQDHENLLACGDLFVGL